jgi:long-chain acyl-CoA synthetase
MQLIEEVFKNLTKWGPHPALIEPRKPQSSIALSGEELLERVLALSHMLQEWGIGRKAPTLLFLENSVDFVVLLLALMNLEAVPIPVNPEYRSIELEEIFTNARPRAVFCESSYLPLVEGYCRGSAIILHDRENFTLLRDTGNKETPVLASDEIVALYYTYRGYGYPLGAMLSEKQYLLGVQAVQYELAARPGEVMMILLPFSHIYPVICGLFLCLLYRVTAVIAHTLHPRKIFQYIDSFKVDYMTAVPELYELLWRCRQMALDTRSLKLLISGGSCLSDELFHNIYKDFGVYLAHGYGLTEFTPVSGNSANHNRIGTVGPVCKGVKVKIDQDAADGSGEILFQTDGMALGYLHRPAETTAAIRDGWFRTGDIGRIDNGYLVFVREKKNTRKVNGNMVDLMEVRRAFLSIPGIDVAHISYSRGTLSGVIEATRGGGVIPDTAAVKKELRNKIAQYKIPKHIEIVYRILG